MKFKVGDRIRISMNHHWAQGATGTIGEPLPFLKQIVEDEAPWDGIPRFVSGRHGPIEFYFVWFDEPHLDGDGDGPYKGGEIKADALELVEGGQ
jgi:hypothetical protein